MNCCASLQTTEITVISSSNFKNLAYISIRERSFVKAVNLKYKQYDQSNLR